MDRNRVFVASVVVLLVLALVSGGVLLVTRFREVPSGIGVFRHEDTGVARFASEDEFRQYLAEGESLGAGMGGGVRSFGMQETLMMPMATDSATGFGDGAVAKESAPRVSGTNVRTEGIDEPDVVKTDGGHIYFSREASYFYRGISEPTPMPMLDVVDSDDATVSSGTATDVAPARTNSLEATDFFSVASDGTVSPVGGIDRSGEMLLFDDMLVSFSSDGRRILGYDVSDRNAPEEAWAIRLDDGSALIEARKRDGRLYLVERTLAGEDVPCPIRPMTTSEGSFDIACTDIYRPGIPAPADSVFTVVSLDPATGTPDESVSFVGATGHSVVYMGPENLYITYPKASDPVGIMLGFFEENGELLSGGFLENLRRLAGYELGLDAKLAELSRIIGNEFRYRDSDDRLRIENEMRNRMSDYRARHLREQESTGIVRIPLDRLDVAADGSVPGTPLNDFSLDEYEGNLRIATTVGGRGSGYWVGGISLGEAESENDVYVLNRNLGKRGEILGLGEDERIYSARFIGDRGYLVTFRETDPFYVLDLSDPDGPEVTGELKIPGYSSYLHPLGERLVLGVGRDGSQVKLSLFDVSDPADPREASKYLLDEYWSEAVSNHHAFLVDTDHEVFFIPGSQGGYVFSYAGDELSLQTAVAASRVKRALYIGDVLYVVGEESIVSYDENTWEKKGELDVTR